MRLTLRTLLSYLDDTLDPAQTKLIGAKVADSEQARDLTERIKQVTRRRRLTTPPTTGPGGIDANTIAEYLDNDVTPETSAEVEQICLASDVHLAEVAACHQILTLVLGEPALVPPSAKQRMYGLVKGPEAIPFRRAARPGAKNDNDLSSEIEPDNDDTLRLGVPAVGGGKDQRNLVLIAGGGVLAACFLAFAIYMLVGPGRGGNVVEPKKDGGELIAQNDAKNKDQGEGKDDDKKKTPDAKDKNPDWVPPPVKEKEDPKPLDIVAKPVEVKPDMPPPAEIAYAPANMKQVPVGQYVPPGIKAPAILLQVKSDKAGWTRLDKDVVSGRQLLSLPGSKSLIALNSGVELMLWGNLVELTFNPILAESRAIIHANDLLDADITLQRGRIVLRNNKKGAQDATARVRFNNPTLLGEENHFDFTLHAGAAVVLERFCVMGAEPFFDNPKDPLRLGPTATVWVFAYGGSANVRSGQVSYALEASQQPTLTWRSSGGVLGPPEPKMAPPPPPAEPPPLKGADQQARDKVVRAHAELVALLGKKEIDVALAEIMQSVQKSAERDLVASKQISPDTYLGWQYAIRCYAAIDDVDFLFREFAADPTPLVIRGLYMQTLQQWLALGRENDYLLLDVVSKNNRNKTALALNIMHLFHLPLEEDAIKPATYEHLIEGLNNDLMAIRTLSHLHLMIMVPEGRKIFYDPADPPQLRQKAVRAWTALIPPGKLPPGMAPMKKDKEKEKG